MDNYRLIPNYTTENRGQISICKTVGGFFIFDRFNALETLTLISHRNINCPKNRRRNKQGSFSTFQYGNWTSPTGT